MSRIPIDDITLDGSLIRDAVTTALRAYQQSRLQVADAKLQDRDGSHQGPNDGSQVVPGLLDCSSERSHVDVRIDVHVCGDLVIHNFPSPGSAAAPSTPDAVGSPPPGGARTTE